MVEKQKPNDKFTIAEMIDAIKNAQGIKAAAARILDCDWWTVQRYILKYKTVRKAYDETRLPIEDVAIGNVVRDILGGSVETSKWWLSKKSDEFMPKQEVKHIGDPDEPLSVKVTYGGRDLGRGSTTEEQKE